MLKIQTIVFFCGLILFAGAPLIAQQAQDEATQENSPKGEKTEPVREPKKSGVIPVPNTLPSTGIISVLGDQATRPDAVYLRRENGDSVFVPQAKYEEFERYLNAQATEQETEFSNALFESIAVSALIREGVAEVQINCKVSLGEKAVKVVDVELGLENFNIQRIANTTGGKRSVLYPSKNSSGFVWAIEPDGSKEYSIRIDAVVKVNRIGLDNSLRLELPFGPTKVDIKIPTSADRPAANIRWIGNNNEVLETSTEEKTIKATVTGRGGTGVLTWNEGATQQNLGALEADTETRLILNRQSLRWDAATKLRIRATGRSGQQDIILELPENAVWIPSQASSLQTKWTLGSAPAIDLKRDSDDSANKAPDKAPDKKAKPSNDPGVSRPQQRQRLLLRFAERGNSFTEEIPIEWRLPITDRSEQSVAIASLTIPDAQRHEGRLTLSVPSDQQFSWTPTNEFQFLNQASKSDSAEFEFRFARQGGNLSAILRTDQAQVRLKSVYLATISKEEVQLDGIFQFTQAPASLQELTFDAPGWTLHGLSWADSADLIPADPIGESSLRVVPGSMVESGLSISSAESRSIRLLASRKLPTDASLDLKLTLPVVRWLKSNREPIRERGDGWLYIVPGPFKIITESIRLSEITRVNDRLENIQSYFQLPTAIESPIAFRFRSGANAVKWEAPLKLTPRTIAGIVDTNVLIRSNGWRIQRQWKLNVQGPLIKQLSFRVPQNASLAWDLRIDGSPTSARIQQDALDPNFSFLLADLSSPIRNSTIELATSVIDPVSSVANNTEPSNTTLLNSSKSPEMLQRYIPLAQLQIDGESTLQNNPASISVDGGIIADIETDTGTIQRISKIDGPFSKSIGSSDSSITSRVYTLAPISSPPVAIDRIWLQTLANTSQIRERVVFKAITEEKTLALKIPPDWDPQTLRIIVDGEQVSFFDLSGDDGYRFPLKSVTSSGRSSHTVELWNWYSNSNTSIKRLSPNIPSIQGAISNITCTWQIAVPTEEVLLSQSQEWLGDWKWTFTGLGFHRIASWEQSDFEKSFGCTPQAPLPKATNQYVLTSLVKPSFQSQIQKETLASQSLTAPAPSHLFDRSEFQVLIVPRYWIWLPVGATLLILSILWNWSPWFRNPVAWSLTLVALGLAAIVSPDLAIIVSQTVLLSMLLLSVVQISKWAWPVRVKRRESSSNTGTSTIISSTQPSSIVNKGESRSGSRATQSSPIQADGNPPKSSKPLASTAAQFQSLPISDHPVDIDKETAPANSNRPNQRQAETFGTESQ